MPVNKLLRIVKNKHEKLSVRENAILKLGWTSGEKAYKALINLLYDKKTMEEDELITCVLLAVSQRNDSRAIKHLKILFDQGVDRQMVLMVLRGFKDHSLDVKLLLMLKSGEIDIRTVSSSYYLPITEPTVRSAFVNVLIKQLTSESYSQKVDAMLEITNRLFIICDERVVDLLIQLLQDEEIAEHKMERTVAWALFKVCLNNLGSSDPDHFKAVKLGAVADVVVETSPEVWENWWTENKAMFDLVKRTVAALNHSDSLVRKFALQKMVWIKSPEDNALLRSFVSNDSEAPSIRIAAAEALAAHRDTEFFQMIPDLLEGSPDEEIFFGVLRMISHLDDSPTILHDLRFEIATEELSPHQREKVVSVLHAWGQSL